MELRVRTSSSRTSKGYSVDATFELSGSIGDKTLVHRVSSDNPAADDKCVTLLPAHLDPATAEEVSSVVGDFCVAKLKRLMDKLEAVFPKEVV